MTFMIVAANSVLWIAYGVHRQLLSLVVSSTLNLVASVLVLVLAFILP